jgi:signal transduction histidine kinase
MNAVTANSLRLRLLFAWAVFILLLLQVAGVGLRVLFERSITRRTHLELAADLRQIKRGMEISNDGAVQIVRKPTDPQFDIVFGGRYWQVTDAGRVLVRSPSLKDERVTLPARATSGNASGPIWLAGPQKQRLYAISEDFAVPDARSGGTRHLQVLTAVDASEIAEDTNKFSSDLYTSLATLAALLFAGAFAHVTIGLRPLEDLRSRLASVRQGRTKQIEGAFPSEIMPLVIETNELLAAQHAAIISARQRASDLAHGLNTPLAVMNAKNRQLRRVGQDEIADEIDKQIEAMRRHVERELARARARGASRTDFTQINVAALLETMISALQMLPRGQVINWTIDLPPRCDAFVDADDFNNMIGNLLENAEKWAANRIDISAARQDAACKIRIEDDGPGIEDEDIPRMLRRGERADTSKRGTGLGLAIVCDLVELYGGQLTLSRSTLGGLKAELLLPDRKA